MIWQCGRFTLDLSTPKIMGIINATPDSFSDGGDYSQTLSAVLKHAEQLLQDGADILDIGGESTRPNAKPITLDEEWQRVSPILQEIVSWQVPISLDTRHTMVMQKALENHWVDMINDVYALQDTGAVALLAQHPSIGICLMHMQGQPENMQDNPQYHHIEEEIRQFFIQRIEDCIAHGIDKNRLILDPGIGFGKTKEHNLTLLKNPSAWRVDNLPYLIGASRKTLIGQILSENDPKKRVIGSVALAQDAVARGAHIVRVHDVKETKQAITIWQNIQGAL